jgi:hypothetical protein
MGTYEHANETCDLIKNGEFLETCAILRFYVVLKGDFVPTFQDSLSVPFSNIKSRMENFLTSSFTRRTWKINDLQHNNCLFFLFATKRHFILFLTDWPLNLFFFSESVI